MNDYFLRFFNFSDLSETSNNLGYKEQNSRLDIQSAKQTRKEAFTKYFSAVEMTGLGFKAKVHVLPANMGGMPLELLEGGLAEAVTLTQPPIYRKENRLQQ